MSTAHYHQDNERLTIFFLLINFIKLIRNVFVLISTIKKMQDSLLKRKLKRTEFIS